MKKTRFCSCEVPTYTGGYYWDVNDPVEFMKPCCDECHLPIKDLEESAHDRSR